MKTHLHRFLLLTTILSAILSPISALAYTNEQFSAINDNRPRYIPGDTDPSDCGGDTAASPGGATNANITLPDSIPKYWRDLISAAAPKHPTSDPRLVAAVLWAENRGWPSPTKNWATSSAGAAGPWQFIPSSWASMGEDGDGDGKKDPNNPADAVHGAFNHFKGSAGKPLANVGWNGNVEADFNTVKFQRNGNNLLSYGASYNGSGAPNNTLLKDFGRGQNSDYVRMVYWLIGSNFSKVWSPESDKIISPGGLQTGGSGSAAGAGGTCPAAANGGSAGALGWDLQGPHAMVYYSQYDTNWASKPYSTTTIAAGGCAPTSMAMIVSTLTGKRVTPDVIAAKYGSHWGTGGTDFGLYGDVSKDYGLHSQSIGLDFGKAASTLKAGGLVVISVNTGYFTHHGHVMVVRAVSADGSSFYVADPLGDHALHPDSSTKAYTPDFLKTTGSAVTMWAITK